MDTIRNYLESMFLKLPNTKEVQKAKRELLQMMTDKYNELKAEGKSENEAVAVVISEFGNIDEIAEDLGIKEFVNESAMEDKRIVSLEETLEYIDTSKKAGIMCGVATALCITCLCGFIIADEFILRKHSVLSSAFGFIWMALFIGVAVSLYIVQSNRLSKWLFLTKTPCAIEYGTAVELQRKYENHKSLRAIYISAGVTCCVLAGFIASLLDDILPQMDLGGVGFFTFVAAGVFLFILCGYQTSSYSNLLSVNDKKSVGGNFVDGQQEANELTGKAAEIMSVYWPTITCIYLCWSFLTFEWHITWIIWPLAAVANAIIRAILKTDKKSDLN